MWYVRSLKAALSRRVEYSGYHAALWLLADIAREQRPDPYNHNFHREVEGLLRSLAARLERMKNSDVER